MAREVSVVEWLSALRSGKYEQAEGVLCNYGRYCCLGVACDLAQLGWTLSECPDGPSHQLSHSGADVMPEPEDYEAMGELGQFLSSEYDADRTGSIGQYGAEMNDAGKSFVEIADEMAGLYEVWKKGQK